MDKQSRHEDDEEIDDSLPAPPIAPDGGIAVGYGSVGHPVLTPARTPENFVCLRGPCRHYWHLVTMIDAGNPADTPGIADLRQHHHTCLLNPGFETVFEDDNAYDCNKWDPMTSSELVQINHRRELYSQRHHNDHADTAAD